MCYSLQVAFKREQSDHQSVIGLEKLYGDFKKLHNHILITFENELKEYQRIEDLTSSGELKASQKIQISAIGSYKGAQGGDPVALYLDQRTSDEFYTYGKSY